jgi:rhodanese-related sulfurtransferase
MIILVVVGSALGLANNALRSDRITLSKSYFAKPAAAKQPVAANGQADPAAEAVVSSRSAHPEHMFQIITLVEVEDLVNDPLYPGEVGVLVDARADDPYEAGHILYARQMNPYHSERYLPDVLPAAMEAEMVVVYCQGGECEDSIFACRELLDNGVSLEKIYLFEEGLDGWEAAGGPLDEGRD